MSQADEDPCQSECRLLRIEGLTASWPLPLSGRPVRLTYAIAGESGFAAGKNCGRVVAPTFKSATQSISSSAFDAAIQRALAKWQAAANVAFERTDDPAIANIVIGAQAEPRGIAFVDLATAPGSSHLQQVIQNAAICINDTLRWKIGIDHDLASFEIELVMLHEIGHVLGLDHPSARGHIMSFRYSETYAELTPGDIAGAQHLYGPPATPLYPNPAHARPRVRRDRRSLNASHTHSSAEPVRASGVLRSTPHHRQRRTNENIRHEELIMKTAATLAAAISFATAASAFAQSTPPPVTAPAPSAAAPAPVAKIAGTDVTLNDEQAKAWINKVVYSSDNKNVGEVAAFMRDGSGHVTEMHADVGGFLGIGETRVRLMPAQFRLEGDKVVLGLTAEQIKALPPIAKK